MSFNNIVVVGVVRNCGNSIIKETLRLQRSLVDFKRVQFLIVESDSDDNTREKLESLSAKSTYFQYISLGNLREQIPQRTERIAYCRNRYLEELENNPLYSDSDLVLIADLDGTNELLNRECIASCFRIEDWDVCTANQMGLYYDLWALRHPLFSPNDCHKVYDFMVNELGVNPRTAKKKSLKSRMFWFHKSLKPFEVDSAFGGLALYKRQALANVRYTGTDSNNEEVCEHVALNRQIKEKGCKIVVNPVMINCYTPIDNTRPAYIRILLRVRRIWYRVAESLLYR